MKKLITIILFVNFSLSICAQLETKLLSQPRANISSMIYGDSIYFVGGSFSSKVDYLNLNDCSITNETYNSDGFSSATLVQNENIAIFYDLVGVNLSLTQMIIYNPNTKEWTTDLYHDNASFLQNGHIVDDEVIFFDKNDQDEAFSYNLNSNEWTLLPSQFTRRETVMVDTGDKIFFMGGKESFTERSNKVDVYIRSTQLWESFTLTEAKNGFTPVVYQNKIVIAGGTSANVNPDRSVDLVEIIDINDYSINTLTLSEKKNNMTGLTLQNKVIFAGGNSTRAEVINMDDLTIEVIELEAENDLVKLRSGKVGNMGVFAGGNDTDGDKIYIYNSLLNEWSLIPIENSRSSISFTETNDKLFLAGGSINFGQDRFDEIYILEDLTVTSTSNLNEQNISIFPNPANESLTIVQNNLNHDISIYDISGKLIQTFSTDNTEQIQLDISNLKTGIYFVKLPFEHKNIIRRFIKN